MNVLAATLALLVCASTATAPAAPAGLKAGAAKANITPPLGGEIVGGFLPIPAKHIHDDLWARALVVDDGKTRLALVVCDILGIGNTLSTDVRTLIAKDCGIPSERVLISATHTHSATSALAKDRYELKSPLTDYQQFVARRIVDAVQCAINNLRPAEMGFGTAQAPEHVNNRRWSMKPGTMPVNPFGKIDGAKMNPPGGSKDLIEPVGPTDPAVSFLIFREPGGRPIALYSSYSLHYVGGVGPGHISADYYGVYCRRMERLLGEEGQDPPFVAMMSNGTSGDINNINFRQPRPSQKPYEQINFVAESVAAKVQAAVKGVAYSSKATVAAAYRELPIAARVPTSEELAWARQTIAAEKEVPGKANLPLIYARRTLSLEGKPATIPVPLQVLRLGDVCIGTMPCEVFCEIGLEFKRRSPRQPAMLVSLAHGYFGYLPTPRQHALGGYETWLGTNRLERTASDKMLAELLKMAAEVE